MKWTVNVCVRFNQQAKSIFSTKYKKLSLDGCLNECATKDLRTFSSLAQSIHVIAVTEFASNFLPMITSQYGCSSMLKELTLTYFHFENKWNNTIRCDSIFKSLERLAFDYCRLPEDWYNIIPADAELKLLQFIYCNCDYGTLICPKFNKLEELRLHAQSELIDVL